MTTYNNIKDYIQAYQNGKRDSLNLLITFKYSTYGDKTHVRLQFTDKKLNGLLQRLSLNNQEAPAKDIEAWFMEALYRIDDKGEEVGIFPTYKMKDKKGRERTPSEVASYVEKTIIGYVKNQIERSSTFGNKKNGLAGGVNVITSTFIDANVEEISNLDTAAYNQWNEAQEVEDSYSDYLYSLGGDSGLDVILTARQLEIWQLYKSGMTEDEVGEQLGIEQQTVNDSRTASKKKIRTGYLDWKMMENITKKNNNLHTIASKYLDQMDKIISFDAQDTFDYYGFTRGYLLENISDADLMDDYERLFSNKSDARDTFYDVLMSEVKHSHYKLVRSVLSSADAVTTKRDKKRFVTAVMYGMNAIVTEAERVVKRFSSKEVNKAMVKEKQERKEKEMKKEKGVRK